MANKLKEKAQNMKSRVQQNIRSIKQGNFLEEKQQMLGEERPDVIPKLKNKLDEFEPGQNVKKIGEGRGTRSEPPIKKPGSTRKSSNSSSGSRDSGSSVDSGTPDTSDVPMPYSRK